MIKEFTLAIDPGTNAMGWALFPGVNLADVTADQRPPVRAGVASVEHGEGKLGPMNRLMLINRRFKAELDRDYGRIRLIVCEYPEVMRHGRGLAASNSGSILTIATAVGTYLQMAVELGALFLPVPVSAWKGNLPKEVVVSRLQARYGVGPLKGIMSADRRDDWDALGIGAFTRGCFK